MGKARPETEKTPDTPGPVPLTYEVPKGGAYEGLSDSRWKWWNAMKREDSSFEWKMPIKFYGKVIDQDDNSVPNAQVRYGWNDVLGSHEGHMLTDSMGLIKIEGLSGKILSVDVGKEGYHSSKKGPYAFEYAAFFEGIYYRPDPANPVIFRLVKKLEPVPLVVHHVSGRGNYDKESFYDLQRGVLTDRLPTGVALRFVFERSQSSQGEPFDWVWKVEATKGALLETNDEFAQLAPANDYRARWETAQVAKTRPFRRSEKVRFYLVSDDNRYAKVDIELTHPNLRDLGPKLTVDSFLNPSGSRNLEYDPSGATPAP